MAVTGSVTMAKDSRGGPDNGPSAPRVMLSTGKPLRSSQRLDMNMAIDAIT
jgi:hypothetical protein